MSKFVNMSLSHNNFLFMKGGVKPQNPVNPRVNVLYHGVLQNWPFNSPKWYLKGRHCVGNQCIKVWTGLIWLRIVPSDWLRKE